jgi:heme oxygenase
MVLTATHYFIELQQTIQVETCKKKYIALLKTIYDLYPDDLLISKLYAKSLIMIHGTIYFAL